MENSQKRFRAFENSVDAQVLVPGVNTEFNDFIRSQTVVPVNKIGRNVSLDPFRAVEMLIHNYEGTPGMKPLSYYEDRISGSDVKDPVYIFITILV